MKKILVAASLAFAVLALPAYALAYPYDFGSPLLTCTGLDCTSFCDILATGRNIIDFVITIATLVLAPVFIAVAGGMILLSGDNPSLRSQGIKYLRGTIIAVIMIMASFAVVNTFIKAIGVKSGYIKGFSEPITCEQ